MDRDVVITGANRGLGLELVRSFIASGDRVHAGCRHPGEAGRLAALGPTTITAIDLAERTSIRLFADTIAMRLPHVDILINNAGINATAIGAPRDGRGPFEISDEDFLAVMNVNTVGPMLLTRALLPRIRAARGLVLNMSSQLGAMSFGGAAGDDIAYNASKAALNMLTARSASLMDGGEVRFVAMHPGWLRTDMGGTNARLEPADAATAIHDTIDTLGPEDSGTFIRWDGSPHEW